MSIEQLLNNTEINSPAVNAWKAQGKKAIGVICCHVPEELLDAADLLPVHLRATGCTDSSEGEVWMSPFSCSFAKSILQYLMDGTYDYLAGIVCSDGCLMAGRIFDNWKYAGKDKIAAKPYFMRQVDVPRLNKDVTLPFFVSELSNVKKELEEFTGAKITEEKLQESIKLYNETRSLIQELYALRKVDKPVISGTETLKIMLSAMTMPKREFNTALRGFLTEAKTRQPLPAARARLMFIGSALDDPEYLKVIEDTGALVVTDITCFGSRYLWDPVPQGGDSITTLAKAYLGKITCPRMVNMHDDLHELIFQTLQDYKVDGIVYSKLQYCEVWGGENLMFEDKMKEKDIPLLALEREQIMTNTGQMAVRVEAFVEMLEGGKSK
jgi:benzoyl-CoA reductase/2-hydroxyglutaryl-CoA dehydratase subunit BcrC/BadD/HgdB